jgi:DNA-binding CsgD family transcriptional regulator
MPGARGVEPRVDQESDVLPIGVKVRCICGRSHDLEIRVLIIEDAAVALPKDTPEVPGPALRILGHAAAGLTDAEIASVLQLSIPQVKRGMREAFLRLSAKNRAEAVVRAVSAGLIDG